MSDCYCSDARRARVMAPQYRSAKTVKRRLAVEGARSTTVDSSHSLRWGGKPWGSAEDRRFLPEKRRFERIGVCHNAPLGMAVS